MMQYHHLPFPEAVTALANQVGLPLPATTITKKTAAHAPLTDLLQQVAHYYYENGQRSAVAQTYFKKRGLSERTVKQFLLGYAPPDWHQLLAHFGQSEKTQKQALRQ